MSYDRSPLTQRVIEADSRRHKKGRGAVSGPREPRGDEYFASLPAGHPLRTEWEADHHWNERHPAYDPTCTCRDPATAAERESMAAAAAAATQFDGASTPGAGRLATEARRARRPRSSNQLAYLGSLIERLEQAEQPPSLIAEIRRAMVDPDYTWGDVSRAIERAKEALAHTVRRNRYPGTCSACQGPVPANEGDLRRDSRGSWYVLHDGPCPDPADEPEPEPVVGLDLSALPAGRYAVPGGTRLKLRVDKPTTGAWAGYVFVKDAAEYGMGKRYGRALPGQPYVGEVQDELAAIMADPEAAMIAYGQLTGTCGRCGRALEDEESVRLGIGPVCRQLWA